MLNKQQYIGGVHVPFIREHRKIPEAAKKKFIEGVRDEYLTTVYEYIQRYVTNASVDYIEFSGFTVFGAKDYSFHKKVLAYRPSIKDENTCFIQLLRDVKPCLLRILMILCFKDNVEEFVEEITSFYGKDTLSKLVNGNFSMFEKIVKEGHINRNKVDYYFVRTKTYINKGARDDKWGYVVYIFDMHCEIGYVTNFAKFVANKPYILKKNINVKEMEFEDFYLDIETYTDENNNLIPYLLVVHGFIKDDKETQTYWGFNCIEDFIIDMDSYACSHKNRRVDD